MGVAVLVLALIPTLADAQTGDVVTYYHTDAVGSVRMITDANCQVLARYDYLPFGGEWNPPALRDPRLFAGKERDGETTFDYVGARYYASSNGRFTTVDPGHVNGDIYDSQSWNAYAYARNNPLRFTDPDGREYEICAYGGSGYGSSCGSVSDQYFSILARNPGAGTRLWGGAIFAGDQIVGHYRQTSVDPTLNDFILQTGQRADALLKAGAAEMAKNAVTAIGMGALRWGLEAGVAYLGAAEIANAARVGAVTEHAAGRFLLRGISPGDVNTAIQSAKTAGQVLTTMGKYGTPQKHYIGTNGITVIVEQGGRNAGKVITAFRTGMP